MTTSGYLYVIKKNGSFGSEYTLLKDRVYNLGSDFRCHLRFPLKGFFGTVCSISTNKTGAAILKKLAPCSVLLNSGVIASPKKLKFGDVLQVGHKVFKWDRLKHNSVQKFTYSSKTLGPATSKMSARKEVRRKSVGDFRSRIKSSTKSALSTWKETNENVAASSSEFSKTKRSKFRSNQKLLTSKSETKPRANPSKIPRMQSVTKRQLKLNINIPKHVDSNQLTPTLNTKDLPPQLKPESIKKAQSLKKSMEIALLSKRKHSDDSFVKMAKKVKLSKDLIDESAGDHLVESETSYFDDSLPIAPDSPLTISPRKSVRVDASPTINSRKSLFNYHNISGIKTLKETPPHKVNTPKKSLNQELHESLNIFKRSSLNKKASGSKSTGKKLKQPAKSSRFSLSSRKVPRSRLISVKTKTSTQPPIALKRVSVVKKSARKTPKVKTTPLRSASKRLSKMYTSPKPPAMETPKKAVSFSISPKGKGSPDAWTSINVPIKTSPKRSSTNNSFNLNALLNGSPMKSPKNSPKTSITMARISSPIKTPGKSSPIKSSQNNSFNLSPLLKTSPVKTPKNSPKASTSSGTVCISTKTRKINVSVKKTLKNASPIKTSPRRSFQNNVYNLVALFQGNNDSATKTLKISPNISIHAARISTSTTPKMNLSAKKTPAKASSIFTHNSLSSKKIIKLEALKARQTPKNTSPINTPVKSSPIKIPATSSPIKTPAKSFPTITPVRNSLSSKKIIKLERLKARQTPKNTPIKTPDKSFPMKTPVRNSLSSKKIIKLERLKARQTPKNTSTIKTPDKSPIKMPATSSPIKTPATSSPLKTPATSSPLKIRATSSPLKTRATSSPLKTPAKSIPTITPVRNSLSSKKIIKLERLKARQTPKNTSTIKTPDKSPIKMPATSSPLKTPATSSPLKTPATSSPLKTRATSSPLKTRAKSIPTITPVRNSLSPKKIIKLERLKARQTPKNTSTIKTPDKSPIKMPATSSPLKTPATSSPLKTPATSSPLKTRATSSPLKTPAKSIPTITPVRNSLSSKKIIKLERLKSRQTPKNTSTIKTPDKSPIKMPATSSPLKTPATSSPLKTPATSSPLKTRATSIPTITPVRNSLSSKKIIKLERLKARQTPKNTSPIKTPVKSSPIKMPATSSPRKTPAKSIPTITPVRNSLSPKKIIKLERLKARQTPKNNSPIKTPDKSSPMKTPVRNSLSSKKIIKLEAIKSKQTPKNASPAKTKLSTRRSSQNIAFNYSGLFEDSPTKIPNFKASRSVRISASPRNSFSPKKTPQIASRIKILPRSSKNSPKVSPSSARTSTSAKKSPIKISPRVSENGTLNLDALFDILSIESPIKTTTPKLAKKKPKLSVSAKKTPLRNKGLVEISPLKKPNNTNAKIFTSPHKMPQINISDQLIQFPLLKTPKVGVVSTSTGRASRSALLFLTPPNQTSQQISPVLTSTGKVKKSSRKNTPWKLSATKTKILKNELLNSNLELSTSTTAARLSMEAPTENVSFSFVTSINSPAAVQRITRNTESAQKSLNTRDYSRISKAPTLQIKNCPNISKKIEKSPKNDLTDVKGVKSLMKTPSRQQRSPKNDLTDVKGVKSLMKTPGSQQRSPKNDLTDVQGVKSLMKTPGIQQRSPKNYLTDVEGVGSLMKTPGKKQQKSPQYDVSDLRGIQQLMNPLRSPKSPLNDLTNITGVKNLFRTKTGHVKSPTNDLTNVQGVKRIMNPFRSSKTHANDLTDLEGVKELFNSPTTAQLTTKQSVGKSLAIVRSKKNITTPNNLLFDSIKGAVDDNTGNLELKKSIITYERKNKTLSSVKQRSTRTSNRKSLQYNVAVNYASIQKWVDECTPAVSQILPMKPKIEESTVLTPTTRRKARLLRGEDCTPTPEQDKPARKIVSRRKVAIATDITATISEIVEPYPQRTRKRLANVETEMTDSANLKKSKRFEFEEPALPTSESPPRSKRGRLALKKKVEEKPEIKPVRGRRKAAKKEQEPPVQEEITEVTEVKAIRGRRKAVKNVEEKEEPIQQEKVEVEIKNVRGRRKAVKKVEEKEEPIQQEKVEVEIKNVRGRRKAVKKVEVKEEPIPQEKIAVEVKDDAVRGKRKAVEENEEPAQQETIEVNAVRGRRKAAKKVEEKEEPIQEEKSVRGRRNASKKQGEKEDESCTQEESKPVRKRRVGRPAKNKNSDKENIAIRSPEKYNSPAIKKRENKLEPKEEKIVKTTRATRTTKKVAEDKESDEVEKKKPTRNNKTVAASQEEKLVTTTRTTRTKTIVDETSPKPATRITRRKK